MIATLVAVLGTLAGTIVAGLMQHLTSTRTTEKAATERRREALATAVPSLLAALIRHREQQYLKIVARREERADTPNRGRPATRPGRQSPAPWTHCTWPPRNAISSRRLRKP